MALFPLTEAPGVFLCYSLWEPDLRSWQQNLQKHGRPWWRGPLGFLYSARLAHPGPPATGSLKFSLPCRLWSLQRPLLRWVVTLPTCLFTFGRSGLPCDLPPLAELRKVAGFQFVQLHMVVKWRVASKIFLCRTGKCKSEISFLCQGKEYILKWVWNCNAE